MQVIETFPGNAEAVYHFLMELFKQDYQVATGKEIAEQEICSGLTYQKFFGKKAENSALVTVEEMIPNEQYAVAISSNRGVQWIRYHCKNIADNQVEISYTEDYLPEGKMNRLNYRFLFPLMKRTLRKRMKLQIQKIVEFAHK